MIKIVVLSFLFCLWLSASGQNMRSDSTQFNSSAHYFETAKQISVRVGVGRQKSITTEVGLALHTCTYGDVGFFSRDYYSAFEWVPSSVQNIYGFKVGVEANTWLFLLNIGLELKYQTDFKEKDLVIMPKIGLGIFGDLNLFYGYSISTHKYPFAARIGRHQLSLVFNFNNHFLKYL